MSEIVSILSNSTHPLNSDSHVNLDQKKIVSTSLVANFITTLAITMRAPLGNIIPLHVGLLWSAAARLNLFPEHYFYLLDKNDNILAVMSMLDTLCSLEKRKHSYKNQVINMVIRIEDNKFFPKIGNEFIESKGPDKFFKALLMVVRQCSGDNVTDKEGQDLRLSLAALMESHADEFGEIWNNWREEQFNKINAEPNFVEELSSIVARPAKITEAQPLAMGSDKFINLLNTSHYTNSIRNDTKVSTGEALSVREKEKSGKAKDHESKFFRFESVLDFITERKINQISIGQYCKKYNINYWTFKNFVKANGELTPLGVIRRKKLFGEFYCPVTYHHLKEWRYNVKNKLSQETMCEFARRHGVKLATLKKHISPTGKLTLFGENILMHGTGQVYSAITVKHILKVQELYKSSNNKSLINDYATKNNLNIERLKAYVNEKGMLTGVAKKMLQPGNFNATVTS